MNLSLAMIPLAFATVDWIAVAKSSVRLRYVAKPGVIITLLALLWMVTGFREGMIFFALALAFSLAGDIALILPREQFKSALVFFLLAHVSYIIAYNRIGPPPFLPALVIIVGLASLAAWIFHRLSEGLSLSGNRSLVHPILGYMLVLTLMVFSALTTLFRPSWAPIPAILTSTGALFFFYSDACLAWTRFVNPIPHGRLKVIISYHLAQIAIIIGAILNFQTLSNISI
jgi:uncharacterized membrane protein YhhN